MVIRDLKAVSLFLFLFIVSASTIFAQRGVSGGRGSINRPEKAELALPAPSPRPPLALPAASPGASPAPSPEQTSAAAATEEEGTDPGTFFFIYGVNALARPRHEDGTATKVVGGFGFNVYLTRKIFIEVDNDNFVSRKPLMGSRTTGFGDTLILVGGDALFENRETSKPNLSFFYGVKFPSASAAKGLGSGEIDHMLFGTVNKNLRGRFGKSFVELDFLEYFAGKDGGNGFAKTSSLAGVFRQWLNDGRTNRLHFEVGGTFATKESNAEMYNLDYFEHFFRNRTMSFRIGGRLGLTPNVPRAGLYTALTVNGKL
ncbi:MAG TPA: hypothetical protein VIW64_16855 [Pyrinomonadaceae bacterium]|jgi:hypothetical protein